MAKGQIAPKTKAEAFAMLAKEADDVSLPGEPMQPLANVSTSYVPEDLPQQAAPIVEQAVAAQSTDPAIVELLKSLVERVTNQDKLIAAQNERLEIMKNPKVANRLSLIRVVDVMDETRVRCVSTRTGSYRDGKEVYNFSSAGQQEDLRKPFAEKLARLKVVRILGS